MKMELDLFGGHAPLGRDEMFEEFWQVFPRKVGKDKARKSFVKAIERARFADIMAALHQQVPYLTSKSIELRPHPTTWLNQGRWQDEVQPIHQKKRTVADAAREFIERSNSDYSSPFGFPSIGNH